MVFASDKAPVMSIVTTKMVIDWIKGSAHPYNTFLVNIYIKGLIKLCEKP